MFNIAYPKISRYNRNEKTATSNNVNKNIVLGIQATGYVHAKKSCKEGINQVQQQMMQLLDEVEVV